MHSVTSKPRRGRKQDDTLPPSRARDVQRAFRARRAAHLANLEARNTWLEAENTELRRRLGMGEDDPPISGPEPELLPLGSPGGSSKGEESFVKTEEDTSPPLFNWDEQQLPRVDKGKENEPDGNGLREIQSWNARRLEGAQPNALGFDFAHGGWGNGGPPRPTTAEQLSPTQQHQQLRQDLQGAPAYHPFPPPPHQLYGHNPLAYLANLPVGNYVQPPPHLVPAGTPHYEPYPMAWPPQGNAANPHQAY